MTLGPAPIWRRTSRVMFVLRRPQRSVDIKVKRKLHDMRIVDRIVGVHRTKQSVGIIVGGFCPQHQMIPGSKLHKSIKKVPGQNVREFLLVWMEKDSNLRRHCQQIYSLSPLATRESIHEQNILYTINAYFASFFSKR